MERRARRAFENTRGSQNDVARTLDLNRLSVSRALCNAGLKHVAVQARIVSLLEAKPMQRQSVYDGRDVSHEWIIEP